MSKKILILGIKPYGASFVEVLDKLRSDACLEVLECESTVEAIQVCQNRMGKDFYAGVFLFFANNVIQAIKSITMLKMLGPEINAGLICPILMTDLTSVPLLSKFKIFGCQEIVSARTPVKGLVFKIQRNLNLLQKSYLEKHPPPTALKTLHLRKAPPSQGEIVAERLFRFMKPLQIKSDFWILPENPVRKISGRWVVMLKGPTPLVGRWLPIDAASASVEYQKIKKADENEWVWTVVDPKKHPYVAPQGKWIFRGQKPHFKDGTWWFVGSRAELNFYEPGGYVGVRMFYDNFDLLKLARDSSGDATDSAEGWGHYEETARDEEKSFIDENFSKPDPAKLNGSSEGAASGSSSFKKDPAKPELSIKTHPESDVRPEPSITTQPDLGRELFIKTKKEGAESGPGPVIRTHAPPSTDLKSPSKEPESSGGSSAKQTKGPGTQASKGKADTSDKIFISTDPLVIDTTRPKLTPIAIAFLVAELVIKRNFDSTSVVQEFCAYVSAALDGVRCEFWVKRGGHWECVNTSGGLSGKNSEQYRESLGFVEFLPQSTPQGTIIAPVIFSEGGVEMDEEVIGGALVFGGTGIEHVSVDSVQSYSVIAKGLAQSCVT